MMIHKNKISLEMWAGIEATVNRVGDRYLDQLEKSGHADRLEDIDRLAELGIKTVRYPILWERIAPHGLDKADWSWADERLNRFRQLGITPIVGLVHHGSGPRTTNLLESSFVDGLTRFAEAVAKRYPWVNYYTPVNEPLTTARFSGLYGVWYPHATDNHSFAKAYLHQINAISKSMKAILEFNPQAQLIQTEDMGKIYATTPLSYQAEFENTRRWLTYDWLLGKVNSQHPMYQFFLHAGISQSELDQSLKDVVKPNIIGLNYYITSERFLDHRLHRYPTMWHSSNGKDRYVDIEAVRVLKHQIAGAGGLIAEAWDRYHHPLAIGDLTRNPA